MFSRVSSDRWYMTTRASVTPAASSAAAIAAGRSPISSTSPAPRACDASKMRPSVSSATRASSSRGRFSRTTLTKRAWRLSRIVGPLQLRFDALDRALLLDQPEGALARRVGDDVRDVDEQHLRPAPPLDRRLLERTPTAKQGEAPQGHDASLGSEREQEEKRPRH